VSTVPPVQGGGRPPDQAPGGQDHDRGQGQLRRLRFIKGLALPVVTEMAHFREASGGELWMNSCQSAVSYAAHFGITQGFGGLGRPGAGPGGLA
jgi:hypothetical protein